MAYIFKMLQSGQLYINKLLLNEKTKKKKKIRIKRIIRERISEKNFLPLPFTMQKLEDAAMEMKDNKTAEVDDIRGELIKHSGPKTLP